MLASAGPTVPPPSTLQYLGDSPCSLWVLSCSEELARRRICWSHHMPSTCCPQLNRRVYFISNTPQAQRRRVCRRRKQHLHSQPSCKDRTGQDLQKGRSRGIPECHRDANLALSSCSSFCLYPHPQSLQTLWLLSFPLQRRAQWHTGIHTKGDQQGLCSFPPPRSHEQNPGGSWPSSGTPAPLRFLPSTAVRARKLQHKRVHTRVRPRTWVSCETAGRQAASVVWATATRRR